MAIELNTYLTELLDQSNADDRLLSVADIDRLVQLGLALSRGEAKELTAGVDDINTVDFDEVNTDSPRVTITMQDLYPGDAALGKKIYYFRSVAYIAQTQRLVTVDGVDATADGTYEPLNAIWTFTAQRAESAPEVKMTGFVVNWFRTFQSALNELEIKILAAPDIYGSRQAEWLKRIETYRNREFGGVATSG